MLPPGRALLLASTYIIFEGQQNSTQSKYSRVEYSSPVPTTRKNDEADKGLPSWRKGATLTTETIIDAPLALVWSVLVDFENYKKWNPFTRKIEVDLDDSIGSSAKLVACFPQETVVQRETLTVYNPTDYDIRGSLHWSLFLKTERNQRLEARGEKQGIATRCNSRGSCDYSFRT